MRSNEISALRAAYFKLEGENLRLTRCLNLALGRETKLKEVILRLEQGQERVWITPQEYQKRYSFGRATLHRLEREGKIEVRRASLKLGQRPYVRIRNLPPTG